MTVKRFSYINFIQLKLNYVMTHVYISDLCFTLACYTPLAICQASKSSTAGLFSDNAQAACHVRNQYRGHCRPPACAASLHQSLRRTASPYVTKRGECVCLCILSSSCLAASDKERACGFMYAHVYSCKLSPQTCCARSPKATNQPMTWRSLEPRTKPWLHTVNICPHQPASRDVAM